MRKCVPLILHHYILCLYLSAAAAAADNFYTPVDNFAVNCGYRGGPVSSQSGRKWSPDSPSAFMPSQYLKSSSASTASTQDYAPQIPCMTARVSRSAFAYSFPVAAAGTKFVRLHFHSPSSYTGDLLPSAAFFSVTVNGRYSLLRNFSAALATGSLNRSCFVKEFLVTVASPPLNITFAPSPGSFAFVNGIEVVSMPSHLYGEPRSIGLVGLSGHQTLLVDNTTAMETVYRLNIDGQELLSENDTGMFRSWSEDVSFILGADKGQDPYNSGLKIAYTKVPNYTAPEILYRTARSMGMVSTETYRNLTWVFPVDSGFYYLVRFHFCEIAPEITQLNQRVFEIYVNNRTADDQMDIMVYAGAIGVPIYREFVVMVPKGQQDLWVALQPNTKDKPRYPDALLNGLEIFKLSQWDGNLAGPNPEPVRVSNSSQPSTRTDQSKSSSGPNRRIIMWVLVLVGVVLLGILVASMLCFVSLLRRRGGKSSKVISGEGGSRWWCRFSPAASGSYISKTSSCSKSLPSDRCRHFSLAEIRAATDDFNDARVIGLGGFGKVYKGTIAAEDGDGDGDVDVAVVHVAIKRLNPSSRQGAHEFRTEIEMLSQLRPRHLVSLIGYCEDHREMILVYDHMANGALRSHLYASRCSSSNNRPPPLTWKQRLEISIGAARGLQYLHAGAKHPIIHRDVKTTNILLDHKWVAKVSDFGLSRFGPSDVSRTHVSTEVKGSFGYLDPEYYRRQQLTAKSDVYSFGIVLFEVLCARAPLDPNLLKDEMNLSEWAGSHYRSGKLDRIVDPSMRNQIAPECLYKYGEIACRCVHEKGIERPSMADVVWNLEFALQLQESAEEGSGLQGRQMEGDGGKNPNLFSWYSLSGSGSGSGTASWSCSSSANNKQGTSRADDSGLGMSGSVFSELVSPRGR